ncbi:hypothetical protein [Massilia sp. DD77]|uniref:hypothetical protein n=1 Tax=Massilia sp. DD77 TaxID=3109349 RepID=UPI0030006392
MQFNAALSVGAWSGNRVLDDRHGVLARAFAASASAGLSDSVRLKMDGTVYQFPQERGDDTRTALREAYLQWDGEETQVRLGPQIVAWGRADRVNPTDNVTARDYTSPLAVDETQRIGAPALSVIRELGEAGRLSLVAKRFRPSKGPSDNNELGLPARAHHDETEYALKFDRTGEAFDWSVSYFDGLEKLRSLQLVRGAGGRILGASRGYAPLQAFGVDGAATVGEWGLRGELARLRYRDTRYGTTDGRLSHWYGIVGVETNLPHAATASIQYFFRHFGEAPVIGGLAPAEEALRRRLRIANNQFHKYQDGFTLRYGQRLWNDRVDYELVGMVNLREHDYAIRPRVNVRYSDHIKFSAGADVFRGREESFFGSIKKNTVAFAEVVFIY